MPLSASLSLLCVTLPLFFYHFFSILSRKYCHLYTKSCVGEGGCGASYGFAHGDTHIRAAAYGYTPHCTHTHTHTQTHTHNHTNGGFYQQFHRDNKNEIKAVMGGNGANLERAGTHTHTNTHTKYRAREALKCFQNTTASINHH